MGVYTLARDGRSLEPGLPMDLVKSVAAWLRTAGAPTPDAPAPVRIPLAAQGWHARVLESPSPLRTATVDEVVALARAFEGAERFERWLPAALRSVGLRSVMSARLRGGGASIGVVEVGRDTPFSEAEAKRLQFACDEFALLWSRVEAIERVVASEALHRALMEATPDLVFVLDEDLVIVTTNRAAFGFAGASSVELHGRSLEALFGELAPALENEARAVMQGDDTSATVMRAVRNGSEVWLQTTFTRLDDVGAGVVMGLSRDVTAARQHERLLLENAADAERRASKDALTGLASRTAFEQALESSVARAQRGAQAVLLFADLDGFKRCNDEFGHAFCDDVLARIGAIFAAEVREVDVAARIGGDEFCAVIDGTTLCGGRRVAERVRKRIRDLGSQLGVPLDASVGLVEIVASSDVRSLLAEADRRMYEHKRRGGDRLGTA